jgi:hypothetical protein
MRVKEEFMRPIRIPTLTPEQLDALEELYRTTRNARLRTRAQMVLLAAERCLTAAEIAEIVRAPRCPLGQTDAPATIAAAAARWRLRQRCR